MTPQTQDPQNTNETSSKDSSAKPTDLFDTPEALLTRVRNIAFRQKMGKLAEGEVPIVETTQDVIEYYLGPTQEPFIIFENVIVCRFGDVAKVQGLIEGKSSEDFNHPKPISAYPGAGVYTPEGAGFVQQYSAPVANPGVAKKTSFRDKVTLPSE